MELQLVNSLLMTISNGVAAPQTQTFTKKYLSLNSFPLQRILKALCAVVNLSCTYLDLMIVA